MITVAAVTAAATAVLAVFAGIQICALAKQTKEANRTRLALVYLDLNKTTLEIRRRIHFSMEPPGRLQGLGSAGHAERR